MPAFYTSGHSSYPHRNQSSELQHKRAVLSLERRAMKPLHLLYSALTCPPSANARPFKSRNPFVPAAQQLNSSVSPRDNDDNGDAAPWADQRWNAERLENTTRLRTFIPDVANPPPEMTLPRTAWIPLNRLRTGVRGLRSSLRKWAMAPSAACECGTDEQIVDHVIRHCPIH